MLLEDAITAIYERSRHTYGIRRIRAALEIEQGLIVNHRLVFKIMRRLGLQGVPGHKKGQGNLVDAATREYLYDLTPLDTLSRPIQLVLGPAPHSFAMGYLAPLSRLALGLARIPRPQKVFGNMLKAVEKLKSVLPMLLGELP